MAYTIVRLFAWSLALTGLCLLWLSMQTVDWFGAGVAAVILCGAVTFRSWSDRIKRDRIERLIRKTDRKLGRISCVRG